ncbi:MAG: imidazole glycerol phosphate synthase subunit HisH [archaeon]
MDYGVGNLLSLKCAMEKVGLKPTIESSPLRLKDADSIVLPGVGNFSAASKELTHFREAILDEARTGKPILGICLGMQLLLPESEEGEGSGLALLEGNNKRLPENVKVPHMGWNTLHIFRENEFLSGLPDKSYVYFVHSFYPAPVDEDVICAKTTYGIEFASVIAKQNIYGTQFHPEKSAECGIEILRNFAKIVKT